MKQLLIAQLLQASTAAKAALLVSDLAEKMLSRKCTLYLLNAKECLYHAYPERADIHPDHRYRFLSVITDAPTRINATRQSALSELKYPIGFLEFDGAFSDLKSDDHLLLQSMIEEVYRRFFVENFLRHIRRSIDFKQDGYYQAIAKLISEALGMELVAIREKNELGSLNCDVFYDYSAPDIHVKGTHWDVGQMPLPFAELMDDTTAAIKQYGSRVDLVYAHSQPKFEEVNLENRDPRHNFLLEGSLLKDVRTFCMFPVFNEDDLWGVISCATRAAMVFSEVEKEAVHTTMQLISLAIGNHLRYIETRFIENNVVDQIFNATALEMAQSARHELGDIAHEIALLTKSLDSQLRKKNLGKDLDAAMLQLSNSVDRFPSSLQKLRYTGDPKLVLDPIDKPRSIKDIWEEAVAETKHRLESADIKVHYSGSKLQGRFYSSWLKEAFVHLLWNSRDAFESNNQPKHSRWIKFVAHADSAASDRLRFDYSDNAGGLSHKIYVPEVVKEQNPNMRLEEQIFRPKVSSKKLNRGRSLGGGGFGLYLARQSFTHHKGSISCSTSSEGCVFSMEIKKNLEG